MSSPACLTAQQRRTTVLDACERAPAATEAARACLPVPSAPFGRHGQHRRAVGP